MPDDEVVKSPLHPAANKGSSGENHNESEPEKEVQNDGSCVDGHKEDLVDDHNEESAIPKVGSSDNDDAAENEHDRPDPTMENNEEASQDSREKEGYEHPLDEEANSEILVLEEPNNLDHVSETEMDKEASMSGASLEEQHGPQVQSDIRKLSKFYGDGFDEESENEYQDASDVTPVISKSKKKKQKKKNRNLQIKNDYNTRYKAGTSKSSSISF